MVAEINHTFGTSGRPAVSLVYPDLATSRHCVTAALSRADIVLVNPTVDGMNLVAKEALFLAGGAPLLLSVNAGAYEQVAAYVTPLQPFDVAATATALREAMRGTHESGHGATRCGVGLGDPGIVRGVGAPPVFPILGGRAFLPTSPEPGWTWGQLFSVMTAWVEPELRVTVRVPALKVPPVTLTTVDEANTGSWTKTAPPGRVPDRLTVMTRPAPGLVTARETP
jgi:hypothetical protein